MNDEEFTYVVLPWDEVPVSASSSVVEVGSTAKFDRYIFIYVLTDNAR